jgi:uroporphyrinogen decarboxylase
MTLPKNKTFIDACFGKKTEYTPVWYMRQAGRYLPQYRQIKGDKNILDIVKNPELASDISVLPVDILGVDAAVLYADIMIPLMGIGVDLKIEENIGPIIKEPLKSIEDVKKLRELDPESDTPYLLETIKLVSKKLNNSVPVIGFSAAPFTLASYLIEGQPSRNFIKTKSFMYNQTKAWNLLMEKLSEIIIIYLQSQKNTGIHAIQLFDSWIGCLNETDYNEFVKPYSAKIFDSLHDGKVPMIHFGTNTASFLKSFADMKCDAVSVDWRIPIEKAWNEIGLDKGIQGNLDPVLMMSDFSLIKKRVDEAFFSLPKKNGYIFNLGHGVLPETPVENLKKLTEYIHLK